MTARTDLDDRSGCASYGTIPPVPAMLQYVGSVGKLTPYASVVPFMIQIRRSPVEVFCQIMSALPSR